MIVLDSNVISELMLPAPDPAVLRWFDRLPSISLWTTAVTVFEIRFGILSMPVGKRRTGLASHFDRWLDHMLEHRILILDEAAAAHSAQLAADRNRRGRPGDLRDTMIAGIVLANHATLATRNVKHFEDIAKSVVNPWEHRE